MTSAAAARLTALPAQMGQEQISRVSFPFSRSLCLSEMRVRGPVTGGASETSRMRDSAWGDAYWVWDRTGRDGKREKSVSNENEGSQ